MPGVREAGFYCVADRRYFLGAVGLVNSLRLVGHDEPIYLLDCGLTVEQRELLAPHVTLVAAPTEAPPWLLKTVAPLSRPAPDQLAQRPARAGSSRSPTGRTASSRSGASSSTSAPRCGAHTCPRGWCCWVARLGIGCSPCSTQPRTASSSSAPSGAATSATIRSCMPTRTCSTRSSRPGWR